MVVTTAHHGASPTDWMLVFWPRQGGAHVGYLSREDAERYKPVFAALSAKDLTGVSQAKLIGGLPQKPSIGVMLDMNEPMELLNEIQPQPF